MFLLFYEVTSLQHKNQDGTSCAFDDVWLTDDHEDNTISVDDSEGCCWIKSMSPFFTLSPGIAIFPLHQT